MSKINADSVSVIGRSPGTRIVRATDCLGTPCRGGSEGGALFGERARSLAREGRHASFAARTAGTTHRAGVDDFLHTIRNAGFRPSQRDTLYRTVRDYNVAATA